MIDDSVYESVRIVPHVDGMVRADWPITGSRVVNDVRGRRPRVGEFSNSQLNTADDVSLYRFSLS